MCVNVVTSSGFITPLIINLDTFMILISLVLLACFFVKNKGIRIAYLLYSYMTGCST